MRAIDELKSRAQQKSESIPTSSIRDSIVAGAVPEKNMIRLPIDGAILPRAKRAAALHATAIKVGVELLKVQSELRAYGIEKRERYNEAFGAKITTVCIPYRLGEQPLYVQVVCQNRYTVDSAIMLAKREELGATFDELFDVEETKVLKADAAELLDRVLIDCGIRGKQLERVKEVLFETQKRVKTKPDFETKSKSLAPAVAALLAKAVRRAEPSVKFPDG
jgi:hypothetical protein